MKPRQLTSMFYKVGNEHDTEEGKVKIWAPGNTVSALQQVL